MFGIKYLKHDANEATVRLWYVGIMGRRYAETETVYSEVFYEL